MAQQFGALCGPSEDPGSVVGTVVINNCLELQFQEIQHLLLASVGTGCTWYTDIHVGQTPIHIKYPPLSMCVWWGV